MKVVELRLNDAVKMGKRLEEGFTQIGTVTGPLARLIVEFHKDLGLISIESPDVPGQIVWVPLSHVKYFKTLDEVKATPSPKQPNVK
jgi:hypothetical protein